MQCLLLLKSTSVVILCWYGFFSAFLIGGLLCRGAGGLCKAAVPEQQHSCSPHGPDIDSNGGAPSPPLPLGRLCSPSSFSDIGPCGQSLVSQASVLKPARAVQMLARLGLGQVDLIKLNVEGSGEQPCLPSETQ